MKKKKLSYSLDPIHTYHHGTCYKIQPNQSVTEPPQYLALQINFHIDEKPKGLHIYLTSNKTWPNIAMERWPQINPSKINLEFNGLVTAMKMKVTENIFEEGSEDIQSCLGQLFVYKYECPQKCNFLSYDNLPICNSTDHQSCERKGRKKNSLEFQECFKSKEFLTFNPSMYEVLYQPAINESSIKFYMSIQNLQKEVKEEVKVITLKALIGSIGGSVGMFFGFSFTSTILQLMEKLCFYKQHI